MSEPLSLDTERSGTVIRSTGSWYDVQTDGGAVACTVRGRFRLDETDVTNPVAVGDEVSILMNRDGTGVIKEIFERRNRITRRAAGRRVGKEHVIVANVDAAWIMQSVLFPKINPGFIDRFLVMAGIHEIDTGIVINKTDLIESDFSEAIDFWADLYLDLGYPVLRISASTGEGIPEFAERLKDKTSVLIGPSGVGKSSTLNRIQPDLGIRIGEISEKTGKGTHTTTYASLYPLDDGGFVADTPGLREFGLFDLAPEDLFRFFVEFGSLAEECKFPNCTHDHEPGCRIKAAVEAEDIASPRYESYQNMLYSLRLGEKDVGR